MASVATRVKAGKRAHPRRAQEAVAASEKVAAMPPLEVTVEPVAATRRGTRRGKAAAAKHVKADAVSRASHARKRATAIAVNATRPATGPESPALVTAAVGRTGGSRGAMRRAKHRRERAVRVSVKVSARRVPLGSHVRRTLLAPWTWLPPQVT